MDNRTISQYFSTLAKLMDIHNEDVFKIKKYTNAAFTIDKLEEPLADIDPIIIPSIPGIGIATAKNIEEILDTEKLSLLEEYIKKTPEGILELLRIKGIGPKKIKQLWQELGIESPGELQYACEENRLIDLKGFGIKTQTKILEDVSYYISNQGSLLYSQAYAIAYEIIAVIQKLNPEIEIVITGSLLRQEDTIDVIEFAINEKKAFIISLLTTIKELTLKNESDDTIAYTLLENTQLLFYTTNLKSFNEVCFVSSCSVEYLTELKKLISNDSIVIDESIYTTSNIQYTPPYLRIQKEYIIKAQQNEIQKVIEASDIKGIIHAHSTYSDGKNSIKQMAEACIQKGFEYLVMSDHSQSSFYAKGLKLDMIIKQHQEIEELNTLLHPFKIFKSIECDILFDGQLDYTQEVLDRFDIVICSIHQHLKMTEEKAMQRLLSAIENKNTSILCHPTGRLLLSRKAYPINHKEIIDACAMHNVVIEINANPKRLDIDWTWIPYAIEKKVMLSINPDAHSIDGIDDIKYGVLSAQKGMLTKAMNLSSLSLIAFEHYIKSSKKTN